MIKRISIRNFKSLRNVTTTLQPVTVLIGRSGGGKTNFVQALRFLRDFLIHRENASNALGGWQSIICATAASEGERLEFDVTFDVAGYASEFNFSLLFDIVRHGAGFRGERLTVGDRTLFAQEMGKWIQPPQIVNPPQAGQLALGVLYGILEIKVAHLALTKGIGCYDFPGTVLASPQGHGAGAALTDDASNFLSAFDAIANNLSGLANVKDILAGLRRLNKSISSADLVSDRSHIVVGHQVANEKVLSFPLAQESEGFRRFFAHLLALYQEPPKQVLVFEEPEKGIYPGALAVLAEYFRAATERGTQILLTTHSPELLKHFGPDEIRVVEMEKYDTTIGEIAPEQRAALTERLLTTDELLTVDDARANPALHSR